MVVRLQKQQHAAKHFAGAADDNVRRGGAHEPPQRAHRGKFPVRFHQPGEAGSPELQREDLGESVREHGHPQGVANQHAQPGMQAAVFQAAAVQNGPDQRREDLHYQIAERLDIVQRGIAAARDEARGDRAAQMKRVDREPGLDAIPEFRVRTGEPTRPRQHRQYVRRAVGRRHVKQVITEDEAEKEGVTAMATSVSWIAVFYPGPTERHPTTRGDNRHSLGRHSGGIQNVASHWILRPRSAWTSFQNTGRNRQSRVSPNRSCAFLSLRVDPVRRHSESRSSIDCQSFGRFCRKKAGVVQPFLSETSE